ncbi:hypothetical protein [Rhodoferax antarcticus]|uniref:Uncharacterized protein n=1 Tax=Rhodoferax antarcticus ANT.BR TaxID=1111071 RepID=A0A1Q8Y8V9_9BURK|nr:hypothetical protein [Rhodoferax antarcticus]OLP04486.1 hypothetical protein BLL52_4177 [Rhodoferax antarcticus ANT.BR]
MSFIIGLPSVRPSEVDVVYLQTSELNNQTLFALERSMRSAVKINPMVEWSAMLKLLEMDGFSCVLDPKQNSVFIHSRPWDEHLTHPDQAQSFFVTFPDDAPYEIANGLFLASRNPSFYSLVSENYLGDGKVVVVNNAHELIYPDDSAWIDDSHTEKKSIGHCELIRDQFCCEQEYSDALKVLANSGYKVHLEELV